MFFRGDCFNKGGGGVQVVVFYENQISKNYYSIEWFIVEVVSITDVR